MRDPAPDHAGPEFQRIKAVVRVDLLENELAHERIDEADYLAGRRIERLFEQVRMVKASSLWRTSGRVDNASAPDPGLRLLERLSKMEQTKREANRIVGEAGLKFLERILAEGLTFAALAEKVGRGGERGTAAVADRFRWLLKELADGWAAKGRDHDRSRHGRSE